MNKSDLEKMQKCQEEYKKFFKDTPFQREIDKIARDIRKRQDNAMAMEFTRTIAELLRENGIVVNCTETSYTKDLSDKSIENVYGVVFDSIECTEHDKPFKDEIKQLKHDLEETQKYVQGLQKENRELKEQVAELKKSIVKQSELVDNLESELSVKENLLKIRNSVDECQDAVGFLLHSEPISVAEQLINANYERKLSDLEKSLRKVTGCNCETTIETVYSVSELRQIAEHLLVYCNHNSEENNGDNI